MKKVLAILCFVFLLVGCGGEKNRVITGDEFLSELKNAGLNMGKIYEFDSSDTLDVKMRSIYGGRVFNVNVEDIQIMVMECDSIKRAERIYNIEQRGSKMMNSKMADAGMEDEGIDKVHRNNNLLFSVGQSYLKRPFYKNVLSVFEGL